jgi:hypothetical protein
VTEVLCPFEPDEKWLTGWKKPLRRPCGVVIWLVREFDSMRGELFKNRHDTCHRPPFGDTTFRAMPRPMI